MSHTPDPAYFKQCTFDWMKACKDRDREKLDQLLAANFCCITRFKRRLYMDRAEWMVLMLEQVHLLSYRVDISQVILHPTACVVVYKARLQLSPDYTGVPVDYVITDTWGLQQDVWQLVARHEEAL